MGNNIQMIVLTNLNLFICIVDAVETTTTIFKQTLVEQVFKWGLLMSFITLIHFFLCFRDMGVERSFEKIDSFFDTF